MGSAVGRVGVGVAPGGGVGTKGKEGEAEFVQKNRRKTRGAATAALVAMAAGLSKKVKPLLRELGRKWRGRNDQGICAQWSPLAFIV